MANDNLTGIIDGETIVGQLSTAVINDPEVISVNGKTGVVTLDYEDVGALSEDTDIPEKTSDLTNDSGFITDAASDDKMYGRKNGTWAEVQTGTVAWGDIGGTLADQTDLNNVLANKVSVEAGKGLSTNDYTTEEKDKLAGIAEGAEVNVNADWNSSSGDSQILNKPSIPTKTSELTNDSGFATETWVEGKGYLTDVDWGDIGGTLADQTDLSTALGNKVDKISGKQLSTNDYTDVEKSKLSGIAEGAEVNVNADWNATSGDAEILNKPSTYPPSTHTHDDLYYTESETDTLLEGKANASHTHTKSQISDFAHTHTTDDITDFPETVITKISAGTGITTSTSSGEAEISLDSSTQASLDKADSAYQKPSTGIPSSDMASAVQTSLGKADTALQEHQSLSAYRTSAAQDVIDDAKANKSDIVNPRINVSLPVSANWTVTATKGSRTVTVSVTSSASAVLDVTEYGTWTIGATSSSATAVSNTISITKNQIYTCILGYGGVYGVEWDKSANPQMTRTDEAEDFAEPVPYVAGASAYSSPFDSVYPWSSIIVEEDEDLGSLVKIPKFYFKLSNDSTKFKLQITDAATDGFHVSPAHSDRGDGKGERDYVYVGRYHCSSNYKSETGVLPIASITRATARSSIHAKGSDVYQYDYAMLVTIWMLYLVEFANWNSQEKIGYGCGDNSAKENVGASDTMPYHTGTMQSARTTYGVGVQYRHIEGLWENCYDWCDGIYYSGADVYAILNPNGFSDNAGGTLIGGRPTANGYPNDVFVPSAAGYEGYMHTCGSGGSSSTYICDYLYQGGVVLCVGGSYDRNGGRGLFYLCGSGGASFASGSFGCRLQKLP